MTIEQLQREILSIDREITSLEKEKSILDKNSADYQRKAACISIKDNELPSSIKRKQRQISYYKNQEIKANKKSAELQNKISKKRQKRNNVSQQLQKEETVARKKQSQEISNIKEVYEKRIAKLQKNFYQSITVLGDKQNNTSYEYDVFVSHASEDKESFVNDFVNELQNLNIKIWYDTNQIQWGDSLRKEIDEGLKKSRYSVVILSKNYIREDKYWTKAELDGLFQLDSVYEKRILPIWHDITKKQLMDFSPLIAGRSAMNTTYMTPKEIANELKKIITNIDN